MNVPVDQMQAQQAPSVRVPKRLPLVSKPGFRSTAFGLKDPTVLSPVSDAALFNCYAELDPEDNQYWVGKRLGNLTLTTKVGGAGGVGTLISQTNLAIPLAIFGTTLYGWFGASLNAFTYTGVGHAIISGRMGTFIPESTAGGGVASGGVVWAVNGGFWQAASGVGGNNYSAFEDFVAAPGIPWTSGKLCDGCALLDYTLYVMDQNGAIWGSNVNDYSHWLGTTVIQAGGRADVPVCLAQQLEYIIAFKSTSLRCFYNAGAAANTGGVGSNLAWVEGADSNFGCLSGGSVQLIDQTLVWATNNDKGTVQVARMDGLQVSVISTPVIERLLQNVNVTVFSQAPSATTSIVYSNGIKRGGHRYYTLTIPPAATLNGVGFTIVYDLDQELWYIWFSPGLSYWTVVGVSSSAGAGAGVQGVFAQDLTSGAFYLVDIDQVLPTDSGTPATVDIYTPNSDLGTRRKKQLNALYFVNDQVSGSTMYVRKTDKDYRKWSPFRKVRLDVTQPSLTRCGSFYRRALNLRHIAATPFRIKAGDAQLDLGTL